jgi:hypothetical protein
MTFFKLESSLSLVVASTHVQLTACCSSILPQVDFSGSSSCDRPKTQTDGDDNARPAQMIPR